ncbi:cell wall-binding repeat-containing protein [Neobacillus sp. OS1-2]|uniref:cell wall-binding repeat-containing protein n=1 Tax=Neobacillus sp. OS1-2 TaxID=3070680 RepID=UPI0027DF4D6E|nr:cell wall-binding repeat-containing protein [Neobacillus sp. OS1-2]WML41227.1 cell wall-binding repeat-containing protein [Neobacillus sp. OS1-2]
MKKLFITLLAVTLVFPFIYLHTANAQKSDYYGYSFEEEPNNDFEFANIIELERRDYGNVYPSFYGEMNINDIDIYQLQLDFPGNLMIEGTARDENRDFQNDGLHLSLLDDQGNIIASSEPVDPKSIYNIGSFLIDAMVKPGNYFIVVESTNESIKEYTFGTELRLGVDRLYGENRYSTAVSISQAGWDTSDTAIITTGGNFPDALCATPLAAKYNAPLLLTEPNVQSLNSEVKAELQRLNVKEVFIVGGTSAISANVETELANSDINVTRLSGADRYETAVKVAEKVGNSGEIAVVTGRNFADALSMSAIAGAKGMPILLTDSQHLPSSLSTFLSINNINKSYVIGGYEAISDSIASKLPKNERIYGDDRYKTNRAIIQRFTSDLDFMISFFATGEKFPDALSGSAFAASLGAPVILTSTEPKGATMELIYENRMEIGGFLILGGENSLPNKTINELMNFANPNITIIKP